MNHDSIYTKTKVFSFSQNTVKIRIMNKLTGGWNYAADFIFGGTAA